MVYICVRIIFPLPLVCICFSKKKKKSWESNVVTYLNEIDFKIGNLTGIKWKSSYLK